MNIRKFWRLSCLTVASLFWASCSESNPQFPIAQSANPDSSADANGGGLGDESSSSADAPVPPSSSSTVSELSSSSETPSLGSSSSSIAGSSSSAASYILARHPRPLPQSPNYTSVSLAVSHTGLSLPSF